MPRGTFWRAVLLASLAGGVARAEERATPRALFEQGMKLLDEGETARACARLGESVRLEPRVVSRMALAGCYELMGRTASAWAEHKEVAALAARAGDSEWQREMYSLERVTILEKKLVRLTITVAQPTPGLVIRHNNQVVVPARLGAAVPVDPGEQTISASAIGFETWTRTFKIAREPSTSIAVPALKKAEPAKKPEVGAPPSS